MALKGKGLKHSWRAFEYLHPPWGTFVRHMQFSTTAVRFVWLVENCGAAARCSCVPTNCDFQLRWALLLSAHRMLQTDGRTDGRLTVAIPRDALCAVKILILN